MQTEIDFSAFRKLSEDISQMVAKSSKAMEEMVARSTMVMERMIESLSLASIDLAEHGWYVGRNTKMGEFKDIQDFILSGRVDLIDKMLCNSVKRNLRHFENEIISNNPSRLLPVRAAFRAHRKKEYYLSIPVLLAQIDGITKELTDVGFFKKSKEPGNKKKYYPNTRDWVSNLKLSKSDQHMKIMLSPLIITGGWGKHESEENLLGITRHSILHGENSTYGTYLNSCKAISLLFYLDETLRFYLKHAADVH